MSKRDWFVDVENGHQILGPYDRELDATLILDAILKHGTQGVVFSAPKMPDLLPERDLDGAP